MKKMNRLPHEQSVPDADTDIGPEHDGLDVEGHRKQTPESFLPGMPGTGGDSVRVVEDGDDVEGHALGHTKGERFLPGMPGTGGDQIRAVETDDDVEGHRV